jgi:hypothetical protein
MLFHASEDKILQLTNTQRNVLSRAAARVDGAANRPTKKSKVALARLVAGLVGRKLMREVRTKSGMPVWRKSEDDRSFSLVITPTRKKMLFVDDEPVGARMQSANQASPSIKPCRIKRRRRSLRRAPERLLPSMSGHCVSSQRKNVVSTTTRLLRAPNEKC